MASEKITQLHEKAAEKNPRGRPPIFKTADELWIKCQEYFRWCDDHPLMELDFRGKDAIEVQIPHPRPYTHAGLNIWLNVNPGFWTELREEHKGRDDGFSAIITHIDQIIYTEKFEGAAVGFFNANIIARDLGLADKKDISAQLNDQRKTVDELFPPTSEIIGEDVEPDEQADK